MLHLILFGPPGAGKGTQSKKIIEKYKLTHISTGEVLRKAIAEKTPFGIEAQKHIEKGYYVPDDMAIEIIKRKMEKHQDSKGFILDGFPRTVFQADELSKILKENGNDVNVMISLEVSEDVLIDRLTKRSKDSCRVDDQSVDIIKKRIDIYNQRTKILKDYYKSLGKQESIDGIGEIDVIFDQICATIEKYKKIE